MRDIHLITDPDSPGGEDEGNAAAAAAAAADETSLQEKALSAFDEGVEEAGGEPAPKPAEPVQDEADGVDEADEADPNGEGADAAPQTDEEKAAAAKAEKDAADKATDDAAVKELNLKGKAEERFRAMSSEIRSLNDQLRSLGGEEGVKLIADAGGLEGLKLALQDAQDQRQWDEKLHEIGCTPQQFGQAMGFIAAINSNDQAVLRQARDNLLKEVAQLDSRLGEKTERHDPLDAFPDLKQRVERGALDEEDALEIARLRAGGAKATQKDEQVATAAAEQQAQQEGLQSLRALGEQLRGRDTKPVFDAKMAVIKGALDAALPALPPAKWQEYAARLYDSVTLPAPAQPPRMGKQPVRQSHATSGGGSPHPSQHKNPYGAFDEGVAEAREAGL